MLSFLLSLLLSITSAQTKPQPKFPPAINITAPNYHYKQLVSTLRDIDFRNFDLVILNPDGTVQEKIRLRKGEFHHEEPLGRSDVSLGPVSFLGGKGSEPEYALLDIGEIDCGGSCTDTGILQVVEIVERHLSVMQQFDYDSSAPGTGIAFDEGSRTLVITARSDDDTPNCCPEHVDVVRFRWDGQRFEQTQTRTVPVSAKKR